MVQINSMIARKSFGKGLVLSNIIFFFFLYYYLMVFIFIINIIIKLCAMLKQYTK